MVVIKEKLRGIYCIENIVNNKKYIGQSKDIERRWSEHKRELRLNKHHNVHLQRAWNTYGEDKFKFYIIEHLYTSPHVMYNILEVYYINEYKTNNIDYGYNMTIGGDGTVGYKLNEEQRRKISEIQKGRKLSKEWAEHISQAQKEKIANGYIPKTEHFKKYNEIKMVAIDCYDSYGNYINTYNSIHEASRCLNLEATNICKVLKRKHNNIDGYVFYYSDDVKPSKDEVFLRCSKCPLILYDLDYNEIKKFHCASDCSEYINISNSSISRAAKLGNIVSNKYYVKKYYDVYPNNIN